MEETLLISKKEIAQCLNMKQCLKICEDMYAAYGNGQVKIPPKLNLNLGEGTAWPPYDGYVNAMPAYVGTIDKASLKWAGGWHGNLNIGLPYIMGTILLIAPASGFLLSVMDGGYITDLRTGAQTGVAARYLARKNSRTMAIIGAGAQGRMNLEAVSCAVSLEEVRVNDLSQDNAQKFAGEMSEELGLNIRVVNNSKDAVRGADIIVTATSANKPLVMKEDVSPGAFIASIGSYPELDPRLVIGADKVIVDSWAQNEHRGELHRLINDGQFDKPDLHAELGEVVAGTKPGRENDEEIIIGCLIGMGMLDTGCAAHVYKEAIDRNFGAYFDFGQSGIVN